MTINALAAVLVMDRTTLGRNILPLQRDGLIEIVASRCRPPPPRAAPDGSWAGKPRGGT